MLFEALSAVLLALAVSLDGFAVGIMYGLQKIRIPLLSILVISFCSAGLLFLAMQGGYSLLVWLDPEWAERMGALLLCVVGCWAVWNVFQQMRHSRDKDCRELRKDLRQMGTAQPESREKTYTLEVPFLGLMVQVVKRPVLADMDASGVISLKEALLLGTALSLDSMGAGIGAALVGFTPLTMALAIFVVSGVCLWSGLYLGLRLSAQRWVRPLTFLPGLLLIVLGISKIFR